MAILVTGGAGYIGSHVVRQLYERGKEVIVLDNLSTGVRDALVHNEKLIVGDVGDMDLLSQVFKAHKFEAVIHFAASIVVPESVTEPIKYYRNNSFNTLNLLTSCIENKISKFIFSSTAAVYGIPEKGICSEDSPLNPMSPYGASKLVSEWMLRDISHAYPFFQYVALRYFNAAGADPQSRMGQRSPNATHLIKIACEAAVGKRDLIRVFGTDYPTPDGTCLRDYIHIEDLAAAHLLALDYLDNGGKSVQVNAGYGNASSVLEVLRTVEEVIGGPLNIQMAPRRPGDPPQLIAQSAKIRSLFGWTPRYTSLKKIVEDAYHWEVRLQELQKSSQRGVGP